MTASDELNRIVRAYAGQRDDTLHQELTSPNSAAGRMLRGVRALAAAPLTLHGLEGLEEIAAWEAARGDNAHFNVDLNDPAPGLRQLADAAAQRVREGRRSEAIELLIRTVRLALVHLGERHRDTPTYINALAGLYYQAGDYETAAHGFERAVELRTFIIGADHTDTAMSLKGLARVREAEGRYPGAVELHRRALNIFEAALGPNHPETSIYLNDLGCALHTVGELTEARSLLERALVICQESEGVNVPNAAIVLGNLAGVLESGGALREAKDACIKSAAILRDAPEADRETRRWVLSYFASAVALLGYETHQQLYAIQARGTCEDALKIGFRQAPEEQLAEATLRNNLGMSYHMLGEATAAHAEFRAAVNLIGPVIGNEHPLLHGIYLNLALCGLPTMPSGDMAIIRWTAFQATLGATHPPAALFGTTGVWHIPWEGRTFPVLLALPA